MRFKQRQEQALRDDRVGWQPTKRPKTATRQPGKTGYPYRSHCITRRCRILEELFAKRQKQAVRDDQPYPTTESSSTTSTSETSASTKGNDVTTLASTTTPTRVSADEI